MNPEPSALGPNRYWPLGLLSLLLGIGVIFFHTPAQIYAANAAFFTSGLPAVFQNALLPSVAILVALAVPLLLPLSGVRRAWAVTCFTLAIVIWVSSSFFIYDIGPLDGRLTNLVIPSSFVLATIVVLVAVAAAGAFVAVRLSRLATVAALGLNIFLIGSTAILVAKHSATTLPQDSTAAALFRASSSRNVFVFLFDSLQADIFDDILKSAPHLQDALDGFTFFPDTVAPATSTYVALPAIHSGKHYNPEQSLVQAYGEQITRGSFLVMLQHAGYDTFIFDSVHPPYGTPWTKSVPFLAGVQFTARQEYLRLLDLSLFRAAPAQSKRVIFNGGAWRARNLTGNESAGDNPAYNSQRSLRLIAERLVVDSDKPAAKFIHLMNTHPPVSLNSGCEPVSPPLPLDRAGMLAQSRCAIEAFADILASLKAKGIYDNSVIVMLSDHGLGFESSYVDATYPQAWKKLVGQANGIFLYKRLNARGKLQRSTQAASVAGAVSIICAETGDCKGPETGQDSNWGLRIHHDYKWRHELWSAQRIPNLRTFAIIGPVWEPASWSRLRRPVLKAAQPVQFAAEAKPAAVLDWGWSELEDWGVWSIGPESSLSFSTEPALRRRPLRLEAKLRTVVTPDTQPLVARVEANGKEIGVWKFDADHPEGKFEAILVPDLRSPEDGGVTLRFHIDTPIIPADIGLSEDPRPLGIGLESMTLHAM